MFGYILGSHLRDQIRFRKLVGWIVLFAAVIGIFATVRHYAASKTSNEIFVNLTEQILFRVLALTSAIFTTSVVSAEVEQRTIVYLLTRPVPRWVLLFGRFTATLIIVIILNALLLMCASFVTHQGHFLSQQYLLPGLMAIIFGALTYGMIFLFISLSLNRSLIYCLLYAFGWELLTSNMPGDIFYASIHSHMKGVASFPHPMIVARDAITNARQLLAPTENITRPVAIITLLTIAAVLAVVCAWWFKTFEYVPREDAE